jgi:hypothetical protein
MLFIFSLLLLTFIFELTMTTQRHTTPHNATQRHTTPHNATHNDTHNATHNDTHNDTQHGFFFDVSTLAGMGPADLLILELANVPNIKQRLVAMAFRHHLPTTQEEIDDNLNAIMAAMNEVKKSDKFKKLLGIMLRVGNQINQGTRKGDAAGITLSSLLKMSQTKTNSGYTLLEYIVMKVETPFPELLKLHVDFENVEKAKRIPVSNIMEDMAKIRVGLTQTKSGIKVSSEKGDTR